MHRSLLPLLLSLTACGTSEKSPPGADSAAPETPPEWCEGTTAHQWDPVGGREVELFPDGLMEVADPTTRTGIRLDPDRVSWTAATPDLVKEAVDAAKELSGFGSMGGVILRFDAPVTGLPTTAEESVSGDGWRLVDLDADPPERVPFEVQMLDGDTTVRLLPLRPLRLGARHAVVVTTAATAADGGCIAPADATRALLFGQPEDPVQAEAAPGFREALPLLGLEAAEVSALSVYTVHDDVDVVRELAAREAEQPVEWASEPECVEREGLLECTMRMTLRDFRDEQGLVDPEREPVEWEIPLTIWLPDMEGPYPIVMYGHGLGSQRSEGWLIAREMGEVPYALVAMEAVSHGDHPSATGEGQVDNAMDFLGIGLTPPSVRAGAIRGNFDQTVLDRLRLLRLLRTHPDLDGDGEPELDPEYIGYLGISLGAILGPELLAIDGDIDGAVLSVGGARLLSIVTEGAILDDFGDLITALVGSPENFDRLVTVAQHVIDPVDPGTWAAHVLEDRFDDAPAPHVLVQVGMYDDVVPPAAGHALARALDVPHLEPVAVEVPLLEVTDDAPLVANGAEGQTVALFQFDEVTQGGSVGPAYHIATPKSDEGKLQMLTFLETAVQDGTPTIIEPYAALAGDDR